MSDEHDIFSNYRKEIFKSSYKKDSSVDDSSETQTTISAYLKFIFNGSEITQKYHFSIMDHCQLIISVFSALFSLVTIFICVMIGYVIISKNYQAATLISLISGLATDIFTGTLILVMRNLLKSRDKFFKENVKAEHFSKIIGLVNTLQNDEDKIPFIKSIVDDYCNNNRAPHDFNSDNENDDDFADK